MQFNQADRLAKREFGSRVYFRGAAFKELVRAGNASEPEEVVGRGSGYEEALTDALAARDLEQVVADAEHQAGAQEAER